MEFGKPMSFWGGMFRSSQQILRCRENVQGGGDLHRIEMQIRCLPPCPRSHDIFPNVNFPTVFAHLSPAVTLYLPLSALNGERTPYAELYITVYITV